MSKIVRFLIVLMSPAFIYGSCNKENKGINCDEVMCTMMFAMIQVEVKDASGKAVVPDEVFTLKDGTKDTLRFQQEMQAGHYIVMDDSYIKELQNKQATFRLVGMKAGKQIFSEPYTISADCCHIQKEAGKTEIIVP